MSGSVLRVQLTMELGDRLATPAPPGRAAMTVATGGPSERAQHDDGEQDPKDLRQRRRESRATG